jgi:hypothetical protein
MTLSKDARGELEQYIDWFISTAIPRLMSRFREKEFKDTLHFQNTEDFLYGMVYGGIIWGYAEKFGAIFHQSQTEEEMLEIQIILQKKDAIMNTG